MGISWTEMLVVGVFALIFIGPKELPAMMQRIGKVVGAVRRMGNEFQRELNRTTGLDQITDIRRSITEPLKKTTAEIAREFNVMTPKGVEPTGILKPADPKAESVVNEIRAQAGMQMTTPPAPAFMTATEGVVAAAPVKIGPARTSRPRAASTKTAAAKPAAAKSAATNGATAKAAAPKTVRKRAKPVESPAPADALPPVKSAATRRRAPAAAKPLDGQS